MAADSGASSAWGTSSYPPSPGTAHEGDNYANETGPSSTAASSVFLPDNGKSRPRHKRELRRFATQCATVDDPASDMHDQHNASSVPIYMTATFKGTAGAGRYDYTRSGNPTRSFLEHHIAKISNARHAFVVSSGMGALDVILRGLKKDDEIVAGNDLYGGSNRLLTYLKTSGGHPVHHVDTTQPDLLLPLLQQPNSRIRYVLLESPTNPLLQIVDIETISNMVHRYIPEAIVIVDNTMMSPFLQRPLELGADVVYDSATKYLSGHHDLMAGAIYCNREDVAQHMAFTINTIGNGLSPFDSFLLLRGIKTMAIRMERQVSTACLVATYLDNLGFKVNFPSLASHPGKEIHDRLAKGPGAVMSFETGDVALSEKIVGATRLWGISVSFGAVNSLISMPCLMSHASIDPKVRKERNLPEHLIRLCVGIEDPDDLLDDLESALLQAGAIRIVDDPDTPGSQKLERVLPEEEAQAQADANAGLVNQDQEGALATVHREIPDFITSAPGKVILFGEHAVVHGVTAIAGALDLRCYCHVSSRSDDKISLILPDVGIDRTWSISELPFDKASETSTTGDDVENDTMPNASRSPDPTLLSLIASSTSLAGNLDEEKVKNDKASLAVQAFLYLYMRLAKTEKPVARTFTLRSALPIGAGLGSSAAVSVCLSSALLYLNGHLQLPGQSSTTSSSQYPNPPASHLISHDAAHLINSWAFVAETILHGNPSGVDNSVSTLGSALIFQKSRFPGEKPSMKSLHHFKSIRFLLTDTKIPRDTKTLVANINKKRQEDPDYINGILKEIQGISDQAIIALDSDNLSRHEQISRLERLVDRNHELLRLLDVSHSALEAIKIKASQEPFGLHTKLTGAGGGGCAVTVVPDDFPEEKLQQLRAELHSDGFACYETAVGGSGVGVLPLPNRSGESSTHVSGEAGAEEDVLPLVEQFKNVQGGKLAELGDSLGKWAYA